MIPHRRTRAIVAALAALMLLGLDAAAASAQERGRRRSWLDRARDRAAGIFGIQAPNTPYDGRFTFVRLHFDAGRRAMGTGYYGSRGEPPWAHDYPRAETHLMKILKEITFVDPYMDGGNVFGMQDTELFRYPVLYISEPGFWAPSEKEMEAFRNYLLKGGFAIFDDFSGWDLDYVLELLERMLPGLRPLPLTGSEPVFDSFFDIDIATLAVDSYGGGIRWYGVFEENDRSKRMMAILAGNGDIGEAWEFSDTGWVPIDISNNAYKLGVNFIVYAMTH
ncbi:MAG TPA: DUF4159 domain-containing protein [Longimicrobiales bacterium]